MVGDGRDNNNTLTRHPFKYYLRWCCPQSFGNIVEDLIDWATWKTRYRSDVIGLDCRRLGEYHGRNVEEHT